MISTVNSAPTTGALKVLDARITELEVLEIDLLRQPRGRHHAPGLAAVDETKSVAELVQNLFRQPLPHSPDVLRRTRVLRAQSEQRRHADMASELRGAEDMGEDGKEKIDCRNPDPPLGRPRRRFEKLAHELRCQVLTSFRIECGFRIEHRVGDADLAVKAGSEVFTQLRQNCRRKGADRHQLQPPVYGHYSVRSIPYLRILL